MTQDEFKAQLDAIVKEYNDNMAIELARYEIAIAESRRKLKLELDAISNRDITRDIPGA